MSSKPRFTKEQKKFLIDQYKNYNCSKLSILFYQKYGISKTPKAISHFFHRNGIKSGRGPGPRKGIFWAFTLEQQQWLKDYYEKHRLTRKELVSAFNDKFGTNKRETQIVGFLKRHKIHNKNDGKFVKGITAWNKGISYQPDNLDTRFKIGHIPINQTEVGTEVISFGYIRIKVAMPNKWMLKHRYIWEQANGKIPKHHKIVFKDGNQMNCQLDNLIMVTSLQHLVLNKEGLSKVDPDLKESSLKLADLIIKIHDKKKAV